MKSFQIKAINIKTFDDFFSFFNFEGSAPEETLDCDVIEANYSILKKEIETKKISYLKYLMKNTFQAQLMLFQMNNELYISYVGNGRELMAFIFKNFNELKSNAVWGNIIENSVSQSLWQLRSKKGVATVGCNVCGNEITLKDDVKLSCCSFCNCSLISVSGNQITIEKIIEKNKNVIFNKESQEFIVKIEI